MTSDASVDAVAPQDVSVDCESGEKKLVTEAVPFDWHATWQMTSMTLGAGAFVLPAVFMKLGWAVATLELLVLAFFANAALHRLLDAAEAKNIGSYEGLAEEAAGPIGKYVMLLITIICCFIGSLSYLGTAKDLLMDVLVAFITDVDVRSSSVDVKILTRGKSLVVLLLLVLIVLPRCLKPRIGGNILISKLGVFIMLGAMVFYIGNCCYVLMEGCVGNKCGQAPSAASGSVGDLLEAAGTMAFSFTVVFAIFPVLQERVEECGSVPKAVQQLRAPVSYSVLICSAVYLLVGLAGAFAYGSKVENFALENLTLSNPVVQLLVFIVGVKTVLLVSIISFPLIDALLTLNALARRDSAGKPDAFQERVRPWVVCAVAAAMVLVDTFLPTEFAFTLAGSMGLSLAAYTVPPALFLALRVGGASRARVWWGRLTALLVLACGLTLLGGSTPLTVISIVQKEAPAWQPLQAMLCNSHQ